jgi:hypothetical protein
MMNTSEKEIKQIQPFTVPDVSDEECANRLAEGYQQSLDESCLITWDEMARRVDALFARKRRQSA